MSTLVFIIAVVAGVLVGSYIIIFVTCGVAIWCETHAPRTFSLTGWMERFWEKRFGG